MRPLEEGQNACTYCAFRVGLRWSKLRCQRNPPHPSRRFRSAVPWSPHAARLLLMVDGALQPGVHADQKGQNIIAACKGMHGYLLWSTAVGFRQWVVHHWSKIAARLQEKALFDRVPPDLLLPCCPRTERCGIRPRPHAPTVSLSCR